MEFDTAIRGALIVDGTGRPAYRGDIGIAGGRIAAVGRLDGAARATVDADGRAAAPGFVDVHTHYDAQVMWDRMLSISPWHGVTTAVMGNCGFTVAPTRAAHRERIMQTLEKVEGMSLDALRSGLGAEWPFEGFPSYLDAIEARGTAINVAALVGHTALRLYVMGEAASERAATPDEVARMRALVGEALAAGAIGFSTSASRTHVGYQGRPVPSRLADLAEVEALAGALGEAGAGVLQATIGPGLQQPEFARLHEACGRPVTWTALLTGFFGPGSHREELEQAQALRRRGLQVVPQVACRPIMFEFNFAEPFIFEALSLFKPVSAADGAGKRAIYADPDFRRRFRERLGPEGRRNSLTGWEQRAEITHFPPEPALEERPLAEVARARGVHGADLALELALASDLQARFRLGVLNTDEDEVAELLRAPGTVIALSDAGAHASQLCDACYATHLLGRWTRERGTFSLEEAVRKLTQEPATLFGIADRGVLAPGMAADMVLFDPATVGAGRLRRVHDLPAGADRLVSDASGVHLVMVNGTVIRRDGQDALAPDAPLPGRLLRRGRAAEPAAG